MRNGTELHCPSSWPQQEELKEKHWWWSGCGWVRILIFYEDHSIIILGIITQNRLCELLWGFGTGLIKWVNRILESVEEQLIFLPLLQRIHARL